MTPEFEVWLRQADRDLEAAAALASGGFHEWACFVALQAAEKAQKAIFYSLGIQPPHQQGKKGHDLIALSQGWHAAATEELALADAHAALNEHAEKTRYPSGKKDEGGNVSMSAPCELHHAADSEAAIKHARRLVAFCTPLARRAATFWTSARLGQ